MSKRQIVLALFLVYLAALELAECGPRSGMKRIRSKVKMRLDSRRNSSHKKSFTDMFEPQSRSWPTNQMTEQDSNTMCIAQRDAELSSKPTVYFFNRRSPAGCNQDIWLQLNQAAINNGWNWAQVQQSDANIVQTLFRSGAYKPNGITYIITHGFIADWKSDWMCALKDAILARQQNANVFLLDWSGGSQPKLRVDYGYSVAAVRRVAGLLATFVNQLQRLSGKPDASNFHLIGHSLGAQISGLVGYQVARLGRITALDPAGPCFTCKEESAQNRARQTGEIDTNHKRRISAMSAQLVVALHTDTTLFGLPENCGHYDVYINGGCLQPGCAALDPKDRLESVLKANIKITINPNVACSHSYVHKVLDTFLDAPSPDKCYPMAYRCRSWEAFQAGECGFCNGQDGCLFIGIDLSHPIAQARRSYSAQQAKSDYRLENNNFDAAENDGMFNDETGAYDDIDDETKKNPGNVNNMFIKTAKKSPTCLYQYQITVAVAAGAELTTDPFYLNLPLGQAMPGGTSNGARTERLIQVSHLVSQHSQSQAILHQIPTHFRLNASRYQSRFYTAFITFKSLPATSCNASGGLKPTNDWSLCRPIKGGQPVRPAELRSSSGKRLAPVQWVAVNYMSGVNMAERLRNSQLYVPQSSSNSAAFAYCRNSASSNQRCYIQLRRI